MRLFSIKDSLYTYYLKMDFSSYSRSGLYKLWKETGNPEAKKAYAERQKQYYHERKKRDPSFLKKNAERERERLGDPEKRGKHNKDNQESKKKRDADPDRYADYLAKRRKHDTERYQNDEAYCEKCKQRRNRVLGTRFSHYKTDAQRRARPIPFELTQKEAFSFFQQDCFYCGEPSTAEQLTGIDRVDNAKGYTVANSVAACGTCNRIKHADTWEDIKRHLEAIVACSIVGDTTHSVPYNPPGCDESISQRIARIRRRGPKRGYEVSLTDEEMKERFLSNCVYCSARPHPLNGIDRVDNEQGYTPRNSVPCCGICNRMKHAMTKEAFLTHVKKIVKNQ